MASADTHLGSGGYGEVFRTLYNGYEVARKEITLEPSDSPEMNLKEITALQKLNTHPNIVRIIDYRLKGTFLEIYMELCDGSLDEYIFVQPTEDRPQWPMPSAGEMCRQLSSALEHCHAQRIVHKDIKPQNVLVKITEKGTVLKLTDFGLTKILSLNTGQYFVASKKDVEESKSLDFTATRGGTRPYSAPELISSYGVSVASQKVDVFAMGIVFYQIFNGNQHPFGLDHVEIDRRIRTGDHLIESRCARGTEAYHLIDKMVALSPTERPSMKGVSKHPLLMTNEEKIDYLVCKIPKGCKDYWHIKFTSGHQWACDGLDGQKGWKDLNAYRLMELEQEDCLQTFFDHETISHFGLDKLEVDRTSVSSLRSALYHMIEKRGDGDQMKKWLERGRCELPSLFLYIWLETYDYNFNINRQFYTIRSEVQKAIEVDDFGKLEKIFETEDLNKPSDLDGRTPLHLAMALASLETATFLCKKGGLSWAVADKRGWTPLHYAAGRSKSFLDLYFGNKNNQLQEIHNQGFTPLHIASQLGDDESVDFLLSKGANVNATDNKGATPLHYAANKMTELLPEEYIFSDISSSSQTEYDNYLDVVKTLLDAGARVDAKDSKQKTPLFYAARNDAFLVAKLLVEHNAEADVKWRKSPLFDAAKSNSSAIAGLLLEKGVSVDIETKDGRTPLFTAAWNNSLEVAQLLLEKGANANKKASNGRTPLFLAKTVRMAELLLKYGAEVDPKVPDYLIPFESSRGSDDIFYSGLCDTPLKFAAEENAVDLVGVLIQHGAKVNNADPYGHTPLYYAAFNNSYDAAKLLVDKGANPNGSDLRPDKAPIFAAVEQNHLEMTRLLIAKGAYVNQRGYNGWTPLFWAAENGSLGMAELLLENGADIKAVDNSGMNAYYATDDGSIGRVHMLLAERGIFN